MSAAMLYSKDMQNVTFEKIKTFVEENISSNQPGVVITSTCKGYRVNNFKIHKRDNCYAIINPNNDEIT